MSTKHKAGTVFLLSLLGILITAFLSAQHLLGGGGGICGPASGCGEVLSSKYSSFLGVPIAFLGLGIYTLIAALTYFATISERSRLAFVLIDRIALAGTLVSGVLMFVQAFVLRAFCPFCTLSALTIALIWVFSGSIRKSLSEGSEATKKGSGILAYGSYLIIVLLFGGFVFVWVRANSINEEIVARVGQEVITKSQMNEGLKMTIAESQGELYEAQLQWVERYLSDIVLQKEAHQRNISLDALLEQEVNARASVADSEVVSYYKQRYKDPPNPVPKAIENIRQFLLTQRRGAKKNALADSLKKIYQPEILLKPPETALFSIDVDGSQSLGPKEAPVTIVVFTDFQCPFCAQSATDLHQLVKLYSGKIHLVLKHFPLSIHKDAESAAQAAECAGQQGKFWEYHDLLFANQDKLSRESFLEYASKLDLKLDQFRQCLDSERYKDVVQRDKRVGEKIGVSGTPTMFINGRLALGNLTLERMKNEIDVAIGR